MNKTIMKKMFSRKKPRKAVGKL